MKLREIIKDRTLLNEVSVFVSALRKYDGKPPQISIGMYQAGNETREVYQLELTRENAEKLIRQLSDALFVQPYTPAEIEHHNAVVSERIMEGRYI